MTVQVVDVFGRTYVMRINVESEDLAVSIAKESARRIGFRIHSVTVN